MGTKMAPHRIAILIEMLLYRLGLLFYKSGVGVGKICYSPKTKGQLVNDYLITTGEINGC